MASLDAEVTVAIEAALHKGLRDAVELVFRQHGVRVIDAQFNWEKKSVIAIDDRPPHIVLRSIILRTEA